ncbi:MAG: GNAT family N-acetyltransferase [Thiohalomonadaceae bacterium]
MSSFKDTVPQPARAADIPEINQLISAAVMQWSLPERVKRLSLPSYYYHAHDLEHLQLVVLQGEDERIVGVAAWEAASPADLPADKRGLLLHGIYVLPERQRQGIGSALLSTALAACQATGMDGLLVKAQTDARAFFTAQGMQQLPVSNPQRDYPHRYWKAIDLAPSP